MARSGRPNLVAGDVLAHWEVCKTPTDEETWALGLRIAALLEPLPPQPVVLLGDLGSGKTTLAKGIVHGLTGVSLDDVTSPTFQYVSLFSGRRSVAHFDLWRLSGGDEFLDLGLEDLLEDTLSLIEWPDRIRGLLPPGSLAIGAEWTGEYERSYTFFSRY